MKKKHTLLNFFWLFILLVFIGSADVPSSLASVHKGLCSTAKVKKAKYRPRKIKSSAQKPIWLLNPMPPISTTTVVCEVSPLSLIEKARTILSRERVSYTPWSRGQAEKREVKLALANLKTGTIKIVSGWASGDNLCLDNKSVQYEVEWWNGFNSAISIIKPENTAVAAILYAVEPYRQKLYGTPSILYTPFSSALLQPELVQTGRNYLLEKIATAQNELQPVASQAFPGRPLGRSPAFTAEDYLNILLAEQMDPGRFCAIIADNVRLNKTQHTSFKQLAERIFVIVGANQEDAYRFTGNYAGARGLAQFTRIGMEVVWDNYPDCGITRNFCKATSQHHSAIKAEICLLDHYLGLLAASYPRLLGSGYEKYAAAAAYNGGPKRVMDGLKQFGMQWLNPRVRLAQLSGKKLLSRREKREYLWLKSNRYHETFVYLMKLQALDQASLHKPGKQIPVQSVKNAAAGSAIARD
jgi:hypothetical protein